MWLKRGKHSRRCNTIALLEPITDVFYLSQPNSSVISPSNSSVMVHILTHFHNYNHKRNTTGREGDRKDSSNFIFKLYLQFKKWQMNTKRSEQLGLRNASKLPNLYAKIVAIY